MSIKIGSEPKVPTESDLVMGSSCSFDMGADIAALVRKAAHNQAEGARKMMEAEDRMATASENEEVAKMRAKALAQLVTSVAGSATSIACTAVDLGATMKTAAAEISVAKQETKVVIAPTKAAQAQAQVGLKQAQESLAHVKQMETITKAVTSFSREESKIRTDLLQFAASQLDADAKAAGNDAQHHRRLSDEAKAELDQARKLAEDAIEFKKEYAETINATMLSLSRLV